MKRYTYLMLPTGTAAGQQCRFVHRAAVGYAEKGLVVRHIRETCTIPSETLAGAPGGLGLCANWCAQCAEHVCLGLGFAREPAVDWHPNPLDIERRS